MKLLFLNSTSLKVLLLPLALGVLALLQTSTLYGQKPTPSPVSVKVANTDSEAVPITGSVNVANLGSAILRVQDVDHPARQPVQAHAICPDDGFRCPLDLYEVPAGKRLVIEYVSFRALIPVGQVAELEISTVVSGQTGLYLLPMTQPSVNTSGGIPRTSVAQQVRLYADPGTKVRFEGMRNSDTGPQAYFYSFSGYLVNVP